MRSSATKTSAGPSSTASPRRACSFNCCGASTTAYDRTVAEQSQAVELFLELAALPTPPGEERAAADVVRSYLRGLGLEPEEDAFDNVYARVEPTAEGTPLFFCAHLDTV